mmetsp:Transcript_10068/g.16461  ORF Transcript_10068/g.16461 Transcript_10068/m.16461 type:complete len:233 (+) Transcript_10068:476-1174(+)
MRAPLIRRQCHVSAPQLALVVRIKVAGCRIGRRFAIRMAIAANGDSFTACRHRVCGADTADRTLAHFEVVYRMGDLIIIKGIFAAALVIETLVAWVIQIRRLGGDAMHKARLVGLDIGVQSNRPVAAKGNLPKPGAGGGAVLFPIEIAIHAGPESDHEPNPAIDEIPPRHRPIHNLCKDPAVPFLIVIVDAQLDELLYRDFSIRAQKTFNPARIRQFDFEVGGAKFIQFRPV